MNSKEKVITNDKSVIHMNPWIAAEYLMSGVLGLFDLVMLFKDFKYYKNPKFFLYRNNVSAILEKKAD